MRPTTTVRGIEDEVPKTGTLSLGHTAGDHSDLQLPYACGQTNVPYLGAEHSDCSAHPGCSSFFGRASAVYGQLAVPFMYRGLCCPDSFFDCWPVSFQQRRFVDFVPFVCPSGVCCLAQTRRSTYVTILFESLATRPHPADLHSDQLRMSEIVQRTIPPKNSGP
jgi:hypothetical protein